MKKKLLSLILSLVICITMFPMTAYAGIEDHEILLTNFNVGAVSNGPVYEKVGFHVDEPIYVGSITTYHWNGKKGSTPGTIRIQTSSGTVVGTWQASGRYGNTYWDVFPDVTLGVGDYYIADSDTLTWSTNIESGGQGFVEIRGEYVTSSGWELDTEPETSSGGSSADYGYTCSAWAKSELAGAQSMGLIPSGLQNADLTRKISRAEFAAVCVKVYEYMAGTKVPSVSSVFTDTSDAEVAKANSIGVVTGVGDNRFDPSGDLTREQAAAMLTRTHKKTVFPGWTLAQDQNFSLKFTQPAKFADDSRISAYARESVYFMAANGILNGLGENKFVPSGSAAVNGTTVYGNATREQAVIIAARMALNLDTSPQQGNASGEVTSGTTVNASGKVRFGGMELDFGNGSGGTVTLSKSDTGLSEESLSETYGIKLSEIPSGKVRVSLEVTDVPDTGSDHVQYVQVGIPVGEGSRSEGYIYELAEGTYSNGRITADVDLNECIYRAENSRPAGQKNSYVNRFISDHELKVNALTRTRTLSSGGHFELVYPYYTVIAGKIQPKDYITKEDADNILKDLEDAYSYYAKDYPITRTQWPMRVDIGEPGIFDNQDVDATYNQSLFGINNSSIFIKKSDDLCGVKSGYRRNGRMGFFDINLYRTLYHEMYHFVQESCSDPMSSYLWFDEASAMYNEQKIAAGIGKAGDADGTNYDNINKMFNGFISKNARSAADGYGRRAQIFYLETLHPGFLKETYTKGYRDPEKAINELTGKSISELTTPFYRAAMKNDSMYTAGRSPWNIYEHYYDSKYTEIVTKAPDIDQVKSGGSVSKQTVTIPAYGARFIVQDIKNVSPDNTLTVTSSRSEIDITVMKYTEEKYSALQFYESKGGQVTQIPVDARNTLIMVTNPTGSDITVEISTSLAKRKDNFARTEDGISQIPSSFKGTSQCREYDTDLERDICYSQAETASVSVSPDGSAYISVGYTSDKGSYDPSTGIITAGSIKAWIHSSGDFDDENAFMGVAITGVDIDVMVYTDSGYPYEYFHGSGGGIQFGSMPSVDY